MHRSTTKVICFSLLLDEIIDHKRDGTAVDIANGTVTSANGNFKPRITTQGWWLHTGIIIYVQNALIIWYSKRQNTVEASTFGSELVALRVCKELIVGIDCCVALQVANVRC